MAHLRSVPPTLAPEAEAAVSHLRRLAAQNSELRDALIERGVVIVLPEDEERVTLDTVCGGMLPARFAEAQRDAMLAFNRCIEGGAMGKLKAVVNLKVTFTFDPKVDSMTIVADTSTVLPRGQARGEALLLGTSEDIPFRRIETGRTQAIKLPFNPGE